MKLKNILYGVMMGTAVLTLNTACTDDLNQFPHNETTSEQVYTNIQNYESVLGKIYASMTATGQESSGTDYGTFKTLHSGEYSVSGIYFSDCVQER